MHTKWSGWETKKEMSSVTECRIRKMDAITVVISETIINQMIVSRISSMKGNIWCCDYKARLLCLQNGLSEGQFSKTQKGSHARSDHIESWLCLPIDLSKGQACTIQKCSMMVMSPE